MASAPPINKRRFLKDFKLINDRDFLVRTKCPFFTKKGFDRQVELPPYIPHLTYIDENQIHNKAANYTFDTRKYENQSSYNWDECYIRIVDYIRYSEDISRIL